MGKKNLRRYDPAFKARVALEAAKEQESLAQIGQRHRVHPVLVGQWKKKLLERAVAAFTSEAASHEAERMHDELLKKIGELIVERDFLARGLRSSR
jgi:transposase-like protein